MNTQRSSEPHGHILVVDDNVIGRKLLARLWEGRGYSVTAVASGKKALEAFQAVRPSLVLMDCEMPILDGYETTRRLRAMEGATGRIPIVAVTLYDEPEISTKSKAAGMDGVYVKPFTNANAAEIAERFSL